jgi:hypothetical protein
MTDIDLQYFHTIVQEHNATMDRHARVMACHCECLAMNAENMWAAIANKSPVYLEGDYWLRMLKWEIIDENNNPII